MQAAEAKSEVEPRVPAEQPRGPSNEEDSCGAAPSERLRGRRAWLITGALAVPLALYAGWDWLAATGLAAILVAVAPCLLMCALGLCMRDGKTKGALSLAEIRKTYGASSGEPPSHG